MKVSLLFLLAGLLLSSCTTSSPSKLETVARLQHPPGNIAVSPGGEIFISLHPFGSPTFKAARVTADGLTPFPPGNWAYTPQGELEGLHNVIGIEHDGNERLWLLDMGSESAPPKVVGWNTRRNKLAKIITFPPPLSTPQSFFQDLTIDARRNLLYIADTGRRNLAEESMPAIVVVDVETGYARRVLDGHRLLQPEQNAPIRIDGKPALVAGLKTYAFEPRLGLNPITLDSAGEWLYFGAMNGTSVYRVKTTDLRDKSLIEEELERRVEWVGPKGVSDGITIDEADNIYVTDLNQKGIGVLNPEGEYSMLVQDESLLWPDGFSFGPDGQLYLTVNQLHRTPTLNEGKNEVQPPFLILRTKPVAQGAVGR